MTDYERETVRETSGYPTNAASDVRTTERVRRGPTGGELIRRLIALLFGVLQALLILRIVLLLLVANQGNDIVSFILGATDPFVEPFRGMFQLDEVSAERSTLDIAAIVALIAWTLIEALVIAALSLGAGRGEDATAA
jgi:YggT family protein